MAREKSSRAKSQTLSLRLDPKTRFALEFLAKAERRNITTVVEDAIKEAVDLLVVHDESERAVTWQDFWDVSEGVRKMLLLADRRLVPSDYYDDELRTFIEQHIPFFSKQNDIAKPDRLRVDVLWPHINEILDQWRDLKRTDPNQVGTYMTEILEDANITPPEWPYD